MKSLFTLATAMMIGSTSVAHGASVWTAFHAGATSPTGDFAKVAGDGIHVGLALAASDSVRNVIGVVLNFDALAKKTFTIETATGFTLPGPYYQLTATETVNIFEAAPFARIVLAPKRAPVAPYLKGGFGLDVVAVNGSITTLFDVSQSQRAGTWLGLFAGFGVTVHTGRSAGLGLEALFHQVQSEPKRADMITVALEYWATPND